MFIESYYRGLVMSEDAAWVWLEWLWEKHNVLSIVIEDRQRNGPAIFPAAVINCASGRILEYPKLYEVWCVLRRLHGLDYGNKRKGL